ncbi:MAG: JAB domain-containing protein [Lachnospiraceae bacterium]|nr:JAB domain-containing protein [Lachnospiraceae bacterium]
MKYKPQPLTETINSAKEIRKILINKVYDEETIGYKETFKVLLLNNANKIIGYTTISEGGLTSTIVDVRVIMQTALVSNASAIILTHNHPSGNTRLSCHDDSLTKKIKAACEIMDIRLLDHIIVTPYDSFYSYCDEGRL